MPLNTGILSIIFSKDSITFLPKTFVEIAPTIKIRINVETKPRPVTWYPGILSYRGPRRPSTNLKNHAMMRKVIMMGINTSRPARNLLLKVARIEITLSLANLSHHLIRNITVSIDILHIFMVFESFDHPDHLICCLLIKRNIALGKHGNLCKGERNPCCLQRSFYLIHVLRSGNNLETIFSGIILHILRT